MDLSKKDKKIARQIIDIGLKREFEKGLLSFETILKDWKEKNLDNQESYQLLYSKLKNFDKYIATNYDYMRGSTYFFIVATQLKNGIITRDEISELSEEVIQKIEYLISL